MRFHSTQSVYATGGKFLFNVCTWIQSTNSLLNLVGPALRAIQTGYTVMSALSNVTAWCNERKKKTWD